MDIRGINGVKPIDSSSKVKKSLRKDSNLGVENDGVKISKEARQLAEEAKVRSLVENSPDIRKDRIDEVKAKLQNGGYDNEEVMNTVAEKLMKVLGL